MKGNYVAKHMNTFNRNSVHTNRKKESSKEWSEFDLEEFNTGIQKHFSSLTNEEKEEFLHGRFIPHSKDELDEEQLKYLNRGKTAHLLYKDDAGFLGDEIDD